MLLLKQCFHEWVAIFFIHGHGWHNSRSATGLIFISFFSTVGALNVKSRSIMLLWNSLVISSHYKHLLNRRLCVNVKKPSHKWHQLSYILFVWIGSRCLYLSQWAWNGKQQETADRHQDEHNVYRGSGLKGEVMLLTQSVIFKRTTCINATSGTKPLQ